MTEPAKKPVEAAAETIIELVETVPAHYLLAALAIGAIIGAMLLLLYDDATRKRTDTLLDETIGGNE